MDADAPVGAGSAPTPPRRPHPDVPPPPPGDWPLARRPTPPAGPGSGPGPGATLGVPLAGLGLSIAAVALYLAAQLGLQLVAGLVLVATGVIDAASLDPDRIGAPLLALVVGSQLAGLTAVLLLLRRRGVPLAPVVGPLGPLRRLVGIGTGLGLLAVLASTLIVSLLVALTGSEDTPEQVLTGDIAQSPLTLLLALLAAVVVAPVAEELLFRGLLHRALRARLALVPATAISSVVFAAVHVDVVLSQPLALVGLTLVGVVLALAYERTGGILVPTIIHAVHNAITVLAVVVTARFDLDLEVGAGIAVLRAAAATGRVLG